MILTSIVPLRFAVSKQVTLLSASKDFSIAESLFGDDLVHECTQQLPENSFENIGEKRDKIYCHGAYLIEKALTALQL